MKRKKYFIKKNIYIKKVYKLSNRKNSVMKKEKI